MTVEITCPSGLQGVIRGFKAKEANHLANKSALRSGQAFNKLLQGCWLETTNPGPYELEGEIDWNKALATDGVKAFSQKLYVRKCVDHDEKVLVSQQMYNW